MIWLILIFEAYTLILCQVLDKIILLCSKPCKWKSYCKEYLCLCKTSSFKFLSNCCKSEKIKAVIFDLCILYFLPYSSDLVKLSFILKYITEKCRSSCNLLYTCDKYLRDCFHH